MKISFQNRSNFIFKSIFVFAVTVLFSACTTGTRMLNRIPVNTVEFEVVDAEGNPITGATVESSNGKSTATDTTGSASINFGAAGIHTVTVFAQNYNPSTISVTLPADRGETKTIHLAGQVSYSGNAFASMSSGQMYTMMFRYLFSSYGYNMEIADYDEGEWTQWQISSGGSDQGLVMKKAFLKQMENGQQWWQVQIYEDGESIYAAEVLFDSNRSSIRRYREKVGDNDPQEKPVTEGWYTEPRQLTEESIAGATEQENIEIEVPKGTFTVDLIRFGVAPEINLTIWGTDEVPGGTVRYEVVQTGEDAIYASELLDYGSDAETMLESY